MGTNLAGQSFTLTFTFDDTKGAQLTPATCAATGLPYYSGISGSSLQNSSPGTAVLQIGNGSWTFGAPPNVLLSSGATRSVPCGTLTTDSVAFYVNDAPPTGYISDNVSISLSTPEGSTPLTTDGNWEDSFSTAVSPAYSANLTNSFLVDQWGYTGILLGVVNQASGFLVPSNITVSGLGGSCTLSANISSQLRSQTLANVAQNCSCSVSFLVNAYPALPNNTDHQPTAMYATFTPTDSNGNTMTIEAAGRACGYVFPWFNWQQEVDVLPNPNPIGTCTTDPTICTFANSAPTQPLSTPPSFFDPPEGDYVSHSENPYPFYFLPADVSTPPISNGTTMHFLDIPTRLVLNPVYQTKDHFTSTAPAVVFTTSLVGVQSVNAASPPLYTWRWQSTFNGTSGGVSSLKNLNPVDPGSGSGGVSIISINGVVLPLALSEDQIVTTASGLAYSRVSQTFNGTITLTNVSASEISGPFQILVTGMTPGVTLANATRNLSGTPLLTVSSVASLVPGQTVTVPVQFKNPSNVTINFTPAIYSGSIDGFAEQTICYNDLSIFLSAICTVHFREHGGKEP